MTKIFYPNLYGFGSVGSDRKPKFQSRLGQGFALLQNVRFGRFLVSIVRFTNGKLFCIHDTLVPREFSSALSFENYTVLS